MSTISLRLSESLHKSAREIARREGVSINQLISTALAEKLSALLTEEYLSDRANRGNQKRFEAALAEIRDVMPVENDQI